MVAIRAGPSYDDMLHIGVEQLKQTNTTNHIGASLDTLTFKGYP